MDEIRARLAAGAEPAELIAEGYARSSVYSANGSLKPKGGPQQRRTGQPGARSSSTAVLGSSLGPPLPGDLANDPEVLELRRELAKVKLQNELDAAKGEVRRLDDLTERLGRLELRFVESFSELSKTIFDLQAEQVDLWAEEELGYLRSGTRPQQSYIAAVPAQSQPDRQDFFEWYRQLMDSNPSGKVVKIRVVSDPDSDPVQFWREQMERIRGPKKVVPWNVA